MRISIILNSFKDVFSPMESSTIIKNALLKIKSINFDDIKTVSISDGGEYSHDVMLSNTNAQEIFVNNIITPYKTVTTSSYLLLNKNTAFISSSHILAIQPHLEQYKNPLHLTTFGLGQLIYHAVYVEGVTKVLLGLGGTSTVDGGIGMAQALGAKFFNASNTPISPIDGKYFSGVDLQNIHKMCVCKVKNVEIITLCDATININEMEIPIRQKISSYYDNTKEVIFKKLYDSIRQFSRCLNNSFLQDVPISDNDEYYGVAGGINLSLVKLFDVRIQLGISYFIETMGIVEVVKMSDLVITGEGKLDNSLSGKMPIGISKIAKEFNKPVLYLVGDVTEEYSCLFKDGCIAEVLDEQLVDSGVSAIVSCHNVYKSIKIPVDILQKNSIYKKVTPLVFEQALREYFISKGFF